MWRVLYASTAKWLPRSCYSDMSRKARGFFAKRILCKAGRGINIEHGATFGDEVELGDYSGIGYRCELHGPVIIGSHVMMGPEVVAYTRNHVFDRVDIPMDTQGSSKSKPIIIEDDCWIGRRAIIMPGVVIGAHSVIAAGAVVTKSVPPFSVWGGVPAEHLKWRTNPEKRGDAL